MQQRAGWRERGGAESWNVMDCLRILRRRKATLAGVTCLGVLITALVSLAQPHVYRSRAVLEIQALNEDFLELREIYPAAASGGDPAWYVQTQAEMLQQGPLIELAARKIHLEQRAEFQPESKFLSKLRKSIRIVPGRNNRIIQVLCDAANAGVAANLANSLAQTFIDQGVEARQRVARQTYEAVRLELEALRPALLNEAPAGKPDATRRLYDELMQKASAARLASRVRQTNIRLVSPAEAAARPFKPNLPLNLMLGLLGSFVVAMGCVMLREQNASVLHLPGEAGNFLARPELGAIPNHGAWRPSSLGRFHASDEKLRVERAVLEQRCSHLSEAFRATLASMLSQSGAHPHNLVITSSRAMEGKTTVVCNLGFALAETGRRVLVIDGDMRRPQLHQVFEQSNGWGLSDVLREWNAIDELPLKMLVKKTGVPNLQLLPGGGRAENILGLLCSGRLPKLLSRFREEFDYVLMDAPPCLEFADARNMARHADGLVLVVRARHTDRKTARAAVERLESDGTRVTGVILNGWDPSSQDVYRYDMREAAGEPALKEAK